MNPCNSNDPNQSIESPAERIDSAQKPLISGTPPSGSTKKLFLRKGMQLIPVKATLVGISSLKQIAPKNVPQPTVSTSPSQSLPVPLKEVKTEPLDEEIATAMVNITEEKPLNLDFLLKQSPPSGQASSLGRCLSEHDDFEDKTSIQFNGGPSSSAPESLKRTRKPTRRDEYVYNLPEEEHLPEEEEEGPVAKKVRVVGQPEGCRCEYIVPDLEKRMDRMMEKIHMIETLVTTIGTRVEQRGSEERGRQGEGFKRYSEEKQN